LQALVLTFSVEVANEEEAKKMIAKIATIQADFTTKLNEIFPNTTITVVVGTATSTAGKDDSLSQASTFFQTQNMCNVLAIFSFFAFNF
jgi:ABC-type Fe3+-hydroxamate transport system substrate-binding protein